MTCPGISIRRDSFIKCSACDGKGTVNGGFLCMRCKGAQRIPAVVATTIDRRVCADKFHCGACRNHAQAKSLTVGDAPERRAAFLKQFPPCRIGHCTKHACPGRNFDPKQSYVLKHLPSH